LLLLIGLTLVSFAFRWVLGKTAKYKATPIDALIVLFFTVLIYSTVTSYFIKDSISVLAVHGLFIAFYFVVVRTVDTKHKLYILMLLLIISGAITSLYGIYQYYTGGTSADAWIDKNMFEDIRSRVGATFSNPNILGEYLIMMIPLGLAALWYKKKPFYNIVFIGMLALMGVCMILTFSRGAWLGLLLAMVGFFVVRDKRMLALLLVVLIISPFVMPQSIMNRFTSIGNLQDTSSSY
jgi:O-antigen ligase